VVTRLEALSTEECYRLLRSGVVGRVGVTVGAIPEILPINYTVLGEEIVFRTGAGTKLHAAACDAPIAFEVDDYDSKTGVGWSVLAVGVSKEVTDEGEVAQALSKLPNGWVPHDRDHVVRLDPSRLSGRRIIRDGS
jgi:nitroimidazol reductase NimA-like FMN-containing flavoprotein (pyridoxamine 5'-phosphate oxidase superfamily)